MDTASHAVWGATIVRKSPYMWWAVIAGALPDIITFCFGLAYYKKSFKKELQILLDQGDRKPNAYMKVYFLTHSLIPITGVTIILYLIAPAWALVAVPYYLHILLDMPTHQGVWATRILYPLSDWHWRNGHDWWRNKWISIGNWTALIIVNALIIVFSHGV